MCATLLGMQWIGLSYLPQDSSLEASSLDTTDNNLDGFDLLFQRLKYVVRDLDKVKVGLEDTGHYSDNILGFLLGKGPSTFVLNLLHTNLFHKSTLTALRRNPAIPSFALAVPSCI